MRYKDAPIRRKLMLAVLITSGSVVFLTVLSFFVYEIFAFRKNTIQQLSILGNIIASNSTASLAFADVEDGKEILSALKAESSILAGCLYDKNGKVFAAYSADSSSQFPPVVNRRGFNFERAYVEGFFPVIQGENRLGTLYLKSDMHVVYNRFVLYSAIALFILLISFLLAYFLSNFLQGIITNPILSLAETAQAISERKDYSVRATKLSSDETGLLTDAFNQMLSQIQTQTSEINKVNRELEEKNKMLRTIQYVSQVISGELEHEKVVQVIVDVIRTLTGAEYGTFFYHVEFSHQEVRSGEKPFVNIPEKYKSLILSASQSKEKLVRIADITNNPALGVYATEKNKTENPLRSVLAAPVYSKSGEVIGGLFFGHSQPGVFTRESENILKGISPQAIIALENARLFEESNRAKDQVEHQRNLLYNIFNSAPSLICMCKETACTIEFLNEECEKYFPKTLLMGKSLKKLLAEWKRQDLIEILDGVSQSGNPYNHKEMSVELTEKGEKKIKYFDLIIQALKNEKKEVERIIVYATDISEQVHARKTIEDFMSVASHELKTPLTTVMAYSELLEDEIQPGSSLSPYVTKMTVNLDRLNDLISDLLDISRIQFGKMHFNSEIIDFDKFIRESLENIKYTSKYHKIIFSGSTNARIVGDAARLEQVVTNILSNAIKYSPENSEILVDVKKENGEVVASFTDFGVGIPKEKMKYLFQRFYRIEEKGTSGLGIGLFITKEIMERHNGKITVESHPSKGTTFKIFLPAGEFES